MKTLKKYVNDEEAMYNIILGKWGMFKANLSKATAMYYKHKELLEKGSISQETYDKYQRPVLNILKNANIPLDSGSDTQQ